MKKKTYDLAIEIAYAEDNDSIEVYAYSKGHHAPEPFRAALMAMNSLAHLHPLIKRRKILYLYAAHRHQTYVVHGTTAPFFDIQETHKGGGSFPITYMYLGDRPRDHQTVKFANF